MFRSILAIAALILIPQCAIAASGIDPAARPGESYDGGPTRTLDLSSVGKECMNLSVDLATNRLHCTANDSFHRLTNVDHVTGPIAKINTQIYGNDGANVLRARNDMTALVGRAGDDELILDMPLAQGTGGAGMDRWTLTGADRVIRTAAYWPTYTVTVGGVTSAYRYPTCVTPAGVRCKAYTAAQLARMGIVKVPATSRAVVRAVDVEQGEVISRR